MCIRGPSRIDVEVGVFWEEIENLARLDFPLSFTNVKCVTCEIPMEHLRGQHILIAIIPEKLKAYGLSPSNRFHYDFQERVSICSGFCSWFLDKDKSL